jgi:hypothetical protein
MRWTKNQHPWEVRRNGKIVATAASHKAAQSIIKSLTKLTPDARFTTRYIGRNITHCGEGGRALE